MAKEPKKIDDGGTPEDKGTPAREEKTSWTAEEVEVIKKDAKAEADKRVEDTIKDRLARQQTKLEEAAEKAKEADRDKKLAEDNEHKTLAEERGTKLAAQDAELQTANARVEELATERDASKVALEGLVNARVEELELEESVKALVMGLPVAKRSEWVTEHGTAHKKTVAVGVKPTPRGGAGGGTDTTAEAKEVTKKIASGAF